MRGSTVSCAYCRPKDTQVSFSYTIEERNGNFLPPFLSKDESPEFRQTHILFPEA